MILVVALAAFMAGCLAHWGVCRVYPRSEDEMLKEYLRREYGRKNHRDH